MRHFCFYHRNCHDGFAAMMGVRKNYYETNTLEEFFPIAVDYHDNPDITQWIEGQGATVTIVDFCFDTKIDEDTPDDAIVDLPVLDTLLSICESVTVIDHHPYHPAVMAALRLRNDTLADRFTLVHDKEHSGAWLTWKHFHGEANIPFLIHTISDFDTWQFKLEHTKAIGAALCTVPFEVDAWDFYLSDYNLTQYDARIASLILVGVGILAYQEELVNNIVANARLYTTNTELFDDEYQDSEKINMMIVDCPRMIRSIVGDRLLQDTSVDIAITYSREKDGAYRYSVRSRDDSKIHAVDVAKHYGGRGHRNAAGFVLGMNLFT